MKFQTALVTGCTSGIGLYLAREFARNGHDLILIDPSEKDVGVVAAELRDAYGAHAMTVARDLEVAEAADEIFEILREAAVDVDIIANSAGHGFRNRTSRYTGDTTDDTMVHLNLSGILRLTRVFLEPMLARGRGRILNTAYVTELEPGPPQELYEATNAFVLSWSNVLAVELKETGVSVTALCPDTPEGEFPPRAGMAGMSARWANITAPQEVARATYDALMNGDLMVVTGKRQRPRQRAGRRRWADLAGSK